MELPDAGLKLPFHPDTLCLGFINAFVYVVIIVCWVSSFLRGVKGKLRTNKIQLGMRNPLLNLMYARRQRRLKKLWRHFKCF